MYADSKDEEQLHKGLLEAEQPTLQPALQRNAWSCQAIAAWLNPQTLLLWLLSKLTGAWKTCWSFLLRRVLHRQQHIRPNPVEAERLVKLRAVVAEPFNPEDLEHKEALRQLWALGFPDTPCTSLKTAAWKDMGWQGEDPGTDFRGAGIFGLHNLLYLGTNQPRVFADLMHKRQGMRASWEYPFAVAGLNLTFTLAELLELQPGLGATSRLLPDPAAAPLKPAGQAFMRLLGQHEQAFEEVYCMAFQVLDRTWLDMKASYMEFNHVLKKTRVEVEHALARRPASLNKLQEHLGLDDGM